MNSNTQIGFLLIDYHSGQGGLEKVLSQVIQGLEKKGMYCTVFFLQAPNIDYLSKISNYKIMNIHTIKKWAIIPKFIKRFLWKVQFKISTEVFFTRDITKSNLDALIVLDFSNNLLRIKSTIKNYKLKNPLVPTILWPHMSCQTLTPNFIKKTQHTIKLFDCIFAISDGLKNEFEKIYAYTNIYLLFNPIYFPKQAIQRNPKKFIYLGRINDPRKQIKELLRVFTRISGEWYLDLIGGCGSIAEDNKFRSFITDLGLSQRVSVSGWTSTPWEQVKDAGVLLLNSKNEGFPLVLLEAMARGIPCLSSNCKTGPNEIIQDNINGWLYDVDDNHKLQTILQEIVDGTRQLPSQETIIQSVQKFSEDTVIENFKNCILDAIQQKHETKT